MNINWVLEKSHLAKLWKLAELTADVTDFLKYISRITERQKQIIGGKSDIPVQFKWI